MRDEGADVVDVGMVGTEMLYFAVGSRDLDGGLMCTASHNPKAVHGREAREARGARAVGRRRHRRGAPDRVRRASATRRRAAASSTEEDVSDGVPARAALKFIDPPR